MLIFEEWGEKNILILFLTGKFQADRQLAKQRESFQ